MALQKAVIPPGVADLLSGFLTTNSYKMKTKIIAVALAFAVLASAGTAYGIAISTHRDVRAEHSVQLSNASWEGEGVKVYRITDVDRTPSVNCYLSYAIGRDGKAVGTSISCVK